MYIGVGPKAVNELVKFGPLAGSRWIVISRSPGGSGRERSRRAIRLARFEDDVGAAVHGDLRGGDEGERDVAVALRRAGERSHLVVPAGDACRRACR